MKRPDDNPRLGALCVSMLAALVLVVVPLLGFGHVHHVPDPAAYDSVDQTDPSATSCLLCRLAHERAIDTPSVSAGARLALAGNPTAPVNPFAERAAAGLLASRGPPSIS